MFPFKGKLSLFAIAFKSKLVNLGISRNGPKEKTAKKCKSYVKFEDKVEIHWAIRAFGKSLSDD